MSLLPNSWNKEKFESPYFEDPEGLLTKCGLQFMAEDGADGKPSRVRDERDISTTSLPSATSLDRSKTAPSQSYDSSPSLSASASASAGASSVAAPSSAVFNCPVCYDDFPLDATVALGCGHRSVAAGDRSVCSFCPFASASVAHLSLIVHCVWAHCQLLYRLLVELSADLRQRRSPLHRDALRRLQMPHPRAGQHVQEAHAVSCTTST